MFCSLLDISLADLQCITFVSTELVIPQKIEVFAFSLFLSLGDQLSSVKHYTSLGSPISYPLLFMSPRALSILFISLGFTFVVDLE